MIPDNHVLLVKLCSFYPGSVTEINQLHERVSVKSQEGGNSDPPAFCFSSADKLTVSTPRLPRQCGLPSSEECQALAEAALCQGDLFAAVKFHLLSSEPEAALHMGIDHVKGTDGPLCVGWWPRSHAVSAWLKSVA